MPGQPPPSPPPPGCPAYWPLSAPMTPSVVNEPTKAMSCCGGVLHAVRNAQPTSRIAPAAAKPHISSRIPLLFGSTDSGNCPPDRRPVTPLQFLNEGHETQRSGVRGSADPQAAFWRLRVAALQRRREDRRQVVEHEQQEEREHRRRHDVGAPTGPPAVQACGSHCG